jgi:hypothetical protein
MGRYDTSMVRKVCFRRKEETHPELELLLVDGILGGGVVGKGMEEVLDFNDEGGGEGVEMWEGEERAFRRMDVSSIISGGEGRRT